MSLASTAIIAGGMGTPHELDEFRAGVGLTIQAERDKLSSR
jgi:hypothetical protein